MSGQSLAAKMLEGAREWAKRLPNALSNDMAVDVSRRRVRLSHARVETVVSQLLARLKNFELREWSSRENVYDIRFSVHGWKLRVETALERVELASGRYRLWLKTPGVVALEESRTASSLMMGVLRAGAGRAAMRVLAERLLPPGIRWDGQVLQVEGPLPEEGVLPARLFDSASLAMTAEHQSEGLWLAAEAWPGLMDLLQVVFGTELPRTPPGA
ncbi:MULTISPECIES: hypothetical protein [Myxococcus]|nr:MULTISPECIES: hypothetical protein [Myxococcus]QZZ49143.1 hypothetical protein MyxoNM_08025 [Myxococcus xanthus]UYI16248.1 hypothetical protein N3T43_07990 [Myxococcus xanthus]UYI23611.1 hypothetical protein N1129_07990 [Myxococcus xanthus]SDX27252.1 hypothetical protein SAMN05444383_106296 [Myxococcus xanthus]